MDENASTESRSTASAARRSRGLLPVSVRAWIADSCCFLESRRWSSSAGGMPLAWSQRCDRLSIPPIIGRAHLVPPGVYGKDVLPIQSLLCNRKWIPLID